MGPSRLALVAFVVLSTLAGAGRADDLAASTATEDAPPSLRTDETTPGILGAIDGRYLFEAAFRSGYVTPPIRGGVNPFGAGFGARAGFDLWHLYVGASVMDYLGGTDVDATDQALLVGLELGWNGRVNPYLTLRPELGLGDTILSHTEPGTMSVAATPGTPDVVTSASGTTTSTGGSSGTPGSPGSGGVTTTVKNLYVQPSFTALFTYRRFFGGLSGGVLVVPGILYGPAPAQETTWICYSAELQLGLRL